MHIGRSFFERPTPYSHIRFIIEPTWTLQKSGREYPPEEHFLAFQKSYHRLLFTGSGVFDFYVRL
jgi:hypothetical protein